MAYFHCLIGGGSSGGGYELTVTCDADFAGTTITCTDGVTTLTQTCPSASPYEVVFEIPNGGDWTISGVVSGQTVTTGVNIPTTAELIAFIHKTITIYSAKEDTVTYTDIYGDTQTEVFASGQSSKQITVDIEPSGSSITFTSGVAKNPTSLSSAYSKTVTITSNTTDVYLMPENTLYWWGYIDNNYDALSTANGWSISVGSSYSFVDPTFNLNNIQVTGSGGKVQGVGNKTALPITKIHSIAKQTSNDSTYGLYVLVAGNKVVTGGNTLNFNTPNAMQYKSANITGSYVSAYRIDSRSGYFYALWYE